MNVIVKMSVPISKSINPSLCRLDVNCQNKDILIFVFFSFFDHDLIWCALFDDAGFFSSIEEKDEYLEVVVQAV